VEVRNGKKMVLLTFSIPHSLIIFYTEMIWDKSKFSINLLGTYPLVRRYFVASRRRGEEPDQHREDQCGGMFKANTEEGYCY
jgi:hypothetical protein